MHALLAETAPAEQADERTQGSVSTPDEFTYYVYLTNGEVLEVAPATALQITSAEIIFLLGELVVAHLPLRSVYFATRECTPQSGFR